MSEKIIKLWQPEHCPITPVGELRNGWTAGTYVCYVDASIDSSFKLTAGTVAMVDKWTSREGNDGDKPNRPAGFMWHGSQKLINGEMAEETYWLTAKEPGDFLEFDENHQLQYQGTGVATMVIASTGIFKTYVFEKTSSASAPLTYLPADLLYVSDNGFWTKESYGIGWYSGYQVANIGNDEFGDFLVISNAW